jgi:hypothetical protein
MSWAISHSRSNACMSCPGKRSEESFWEDKDKEGGYQQGCTEAIKDIYLGLDRHRKTD